MKRFVDIATAIFLGVLIGAAAFALVPRDEPHSDIVSFQMKPITPEGQRI